MVAPAHRVAADDAGVTVWTAAGEQKLAWDELAAVTIWTSDAGPFEDDLEGRQVAEARGLVAPDAGPRTYGGR